MLKNIDLLREEILRIDYKIKDLFLERLNIVKDILEFKLINNLDIEDKKREEDLKLCLSCNKYYNELLECIIKISKKYQEDLCINLV